MTEYDPKIQFLERSLKRLWVLVFLLIFSFAGFVSFGQHDVWVRADSIPPVITAKQFVVVDDSGNQSVVIGSFPDLNSPLTNGAKFRGLTVLSTDHKQLASLGLGVPKDPPTSSLTTPYTEVFLQSPDGTSSQAALQNFGTPTSSCCQSNGAMLNLT
jgi:hypothetical protein